MRSDYLDYEKPVVLPIIKYDVGKLVVFGQRKMQSVELFPFDVKALVCGVSEVKKLSVWRKPWRELLDDRLLNFIMPPRLQFESCAAGETNRNACCLPFPFKNLSQSHFG